MATISLIQVRVEYVQMEDFKYLSQWRKHVSGGQDDSQRKENVDLNLIFYTGKLLIQRDLTYSDI